MAMTLSTHNWLTRSCSGAPSAKRLVVAYATMYKMRESCVNDRLDGLHKLLIFATFAFTSATLAGYGAMVALIVTRT